MSPVNLSQGPDTSANRYKLTSMTLPEMCTLPASNTRWHSVPTILSPDSMRPTGAPHRLALEGCDVRLLFTQTCVDMTSTAFRSAKHMFSVRSQDERPTKLILILKTITAASVDGGSRWKTNVYKADSDTTIPCSATIVTYTSESMGRTTMSGKKGRSRERIDSIEP